MKIIKEGDVLFRNGAIKAINNFVIEEGTQQELEEYVFQTYIFKREN